MEESIEWEFDSCMTEMFGLGEVDVNQYSPLTLAYIGDSIYDLIIKTLVVNEGNKQVQKDEPFRAGFCAVSDDAGSAGETYRGGACGIQKRKER